MGSLWAELLVCSEFILSVLVQFVKLHIHRSGIEHRAANKMGSVLTTVIELLRLDLRDNVFETCTERHCVN